MSAMCDKLKQAALLRRFKDHLDLTEGARVTGEVCSATKVDLPGEIYTCACGGETICEIPNPTELDTPGIPARICVMCARGMDRPRYGGSAAPEAQPA